MKKLCTITLCSVLFAGLYLAGCDTTTISNGDIDSSEQVGEQQSAAKVAKIDICHKRNGNPFILIHIAESAKPAHIAHGDLFPGDAVPGMAGFIFDDDCDTIESVVCVDEDDRQLTEAELCGGTVYLTLQDSDTNCDNVCVSLCGGVVNKIYLGGMQIQVDATCDENS